MKDDTEIRLREWFGRQMPEEPERLHQYLIGVPQARALPRRGGNGMWTSRTRIALAGLAASLVLAVVVGSVLMTLNGRHSTVGSSDTPEPTPTGSPSARPTVAGLAPTGSMSHARVSPSAVVLKDGRVLVVGGEAAVPSGGPKELSAETYDPATGKFAAAGQMSVRRYGPAVALLPDGRVLVAGGHDGTHSMTSAEIFDPATNSFSPTGSLHSSHDWGRAISLADGRVLVVGGLNGTAQAEIYDPATREFATTGSMAGPRGEFAAVLLRDGRVLVAGGSVPEDGMFAETATAEIYDPATGRFTATGSLAQPREEPTATLLADGRVLVAGDGGDTPEELYDPQTGKFSATGTMIERRNGCSATPLPDGRVLIVGGQAVLPVERAGDYRVLTTTEIYDPTTRAFSPGPKLSMARTYASSVLLRDGSVLVIGGYGGSGSDLLVGAAVIQSSAEVGLP